VEEIGKFEFEDFPTIVAVLLMHLDPPVRGGAGHGAWSLKIDGDRVRLQSRLITRRIASVWRARSHWCA
jgi:hypothetical protein